MVLHGGVRIKSLGIIGAGPAGIFAALQAAQGGWDVHLLDSNQQVGRKLLVTGSGRCNITNRNICAERYTSSDKSFVGRVIEGFNQNRLLEYLDELGILTYATDDGWVYPISNSAANVANLLHAHLKAARIKLHLGTTVTEIKPVDNQFSVISGESSQKFSFDRLIIASGGKAYPALGSRGTLFPILARLGHTLLPVLPALAPLQTDNKPIHKLQGVRLDAGVKLFEGSRLLGESVGNIIFTEWGINGPGVMDISHLAAQHPGPELTLMLNFLPFQRLDFRLLTGKDNLKEIPFSTLLGAMLPIKLVQQIFQTLGISLENTAAVLGDKKVDLILRNLSEFKIRVKGTRGFEYSQASTGGIFPGEVDGTSMQSCLLPGLFFAGEVLDVVGPCGGYNLHWAFSSGYLAGCSAGK